MSVLHRFRDIITYFTKLKKVTWPKHILFSGNLSFTQ